MLAVIYVPGRIHSDYHGLERASQYTKYLVAVAGLHLATRRLRPRGYPPEDIPKELLPPEKDHRGLMK